MPDTLTADALAICRAIDGGDDGALSVLADALEEAGDGRAAGLRLAGNRRPDPCDWDRRAPAHWHWHPCEPAGSPHHVPPAVHARLLGWVEHRSYTGNIEQTWPTRSAAFLALAAALAQEG